MYRPGEPIPEDMKINGWQEFEGWKKLKPIYSWIDCRPGEPIPEDMKYDGW